MKKGVLLVNLGTPDNPGRKAVYRYLKEFLLDPRVIDYPWLRRHLLVRGIIAPFRSADSSKGYRLLWTNEGSPLKHYSQLLTKGVEEILGIDYEVTLAMRYRSPSIEAGLNHLLNCNVSQIVVLPLFPQYASASTGSVHQEVMRVLSVEQAIPPLRLINSFYGHPDMIEVFVQNARRYALREYDHFVFSFHGLPEHQLKKTGRNSQCQCDGVCCLAMDENNQYCYAAQCFATAKAIRQRLELQEESCTVCFQSRLGKMPWIKPYTDHVLKELLDDGKKHVLVFSPSFVSDCLETIVEIGYEYKEAFVKGGGIRLDLVASLNDDPAWIKAVAGMVS